MSYQDLEALFYGGELLEAEALAKKIAKQDVDEKTDELVKRVLNRMTEIRRWNVEGKPSAYCDPPSWEDQPKFQFALDKIEAHFNGRPKSKVRVLDVGCFTGYFSRTLADQGYECYACDIQTKLLTFLAVRYPRVQFHYCRAEDVTDAYEDMDVVAMFDTLEHVLDDRRSVRAALKVLRPNGLLLVNVPKKEADYRDDAHEHLRMYTERSLVELIPGSVVEYCKDEHGRQTLFLTHIKEAEACTSPHTSSAKSSTDSQSQSIPAKSPS
jgi:2-polyprenyl-3-methyl-5-hydroxy-6-metoxy-1,4-benzoquinol methylase